MKERNSQTTIIDLSGKILFFSLQHFIDKIAKGDCCFICGADPADKEFNNEHIIPDWILRRFKLYSQFITLPNGTKFRYGQYTVPCCIDCNRELGDHYERPISELLQLDYNDINQRIHDDPELMQLLFRWINLIYLKTHLKDKELRLDRDLRKETGTIGDIHYWEDMHHIHCIARSHYTKADIDKRTTGTIIIVPVQSPNEHDKFDYVDSAFGKGILLQLDNFCIVAVLNDACAVGSVMRERLMKIKGTLIPHQAREILAHFNYINLSLKEPPTFHSVITAENKYQIKVEGPDMIYLLPEEERFVSIGSFLRLYIEPFLEGHPDKEKLLNEIEADKRGFLWDENGDFVNYIDKNTANN